MKVFKKRSPVTVDVDDTLVAWPEDYEEKYSDRIQFNWYGKTVWLKPIPYIIHLLKSHKTRGFTIIVWSGNGYAWAQEVIKVLELGKYVDLIMEKPSKYIDDKNANDWMQHVDVGSIMRKPVD